MRSATPIPNGMRPRQGYRPAFTLVEATVAMAITLVAASTLLLAIESTISSGDTALDRVIANGMADQLLEEIRHTHYTAPGSSPTMYPLGPNATELAGPGWSLYNDSDDFHQFTAAAPVDRFGKPLGTGNDAGSRRHENFRLPETMLSRWRQRVEVYYVNASALAERLPAGQTSDFRAVEVIIERAGQNDVYETLANRRFVYAYVPPGS